MVISNTVIFRFDVILFTYKLAMLNHHHLNFLEIITYSSQLLHFYQLTILTICTKAPLKCLD